MAESGKTFMKKNWLAVIHVAQAQLNLTDDTYRSLLKERYGVRSARELTADQGKDLIDHFRSLGWQPVRKAKPCLRCIPRPKHDAIPADIVYSASPQQLAKIEGLRRDIQWRTVDGFSRWLRRFFKIRQVKSSVEASQVIYALLRLWRSQHKCSCSLIKES